MNHRIRPILPQTKEEVKMDDGAILPMDSITGRDRKPPHLCPRLALDSSSKRGIMAWNSNKRGRLVHQQSLPRRSWRR